MFRSIILLFCVCGTLAYPEPRGILDGVIKNILENARANLTNLVLPDINTNITNTALDVNITTTNITTSNLDLFVIEALDTTLLPIRLDILTLHWENVTLFGDYFLEGIIDIEELQGPVKLNGGGNASIILRDLNFTIGATFRSEQGHLQIKELTLLSARLGESIIQLENLFDGGNLELIMNVFLSYFIPEFVNDQGDEVLHELEPILITEINKILAEINFP